MRSTTRPFHLFGALLATVAFAVSPIQAAAQEKATATKVVPASSYLDEARTVLDGVPKDAPTLAMRQLNDVHKRFADLSEQYKAQVGKVGPELMLQDRRADHVTTWKDPFADVERDLAILIGGGTDSKSDDLPNLKPEVRAGLEQFRSKLELFFVAATSETAEGAAN